ncbi:MAG TPA: type II secretion system protein [Phycisphaerales bacterium]|nr:type II secretion system protein [Phycisphaerales bacterium]HIB00777.1 type II secretion system protein [Phycisphaerales bacterium]HIB50633.1 type II secretion system protein [Phycisphaerales bacterium]HIN84666.1 type II secretion system protein [Phycisphaerales bacterium]HIO19950.1 type II secretion system protein [Phycisphaerales bacterium]
MSIKTRRGFTLIELLVVIAILAILVGLVVVVASAMMKQAKSTKDMGNHRTIGSATWSFAADNKGMLLHPRTEPTGSGTPSTQEQIDRFWVAAHGDDIDGNARVETVEGKQVELLTALKDGAAYQYIGDVTVYQSPLDPTIGQIDQFVSGNTNIPTSRIRSYSLNAFVGVEGDEIVDVSTPLLVSTLTLSQVPQPSNTMCSIGEQDKDGRNLNGWLVNPTTANNFVDFPAFWDEGKVNVSYIDGSTGSIKLESDALEAAWESNGHNVTVDAGSMEYKQFKKIMLPGVIGSILDQ